MKLRIGDFERHGEKGSFAHYFSHILPDGREVCLESCLAGYCVGIYDKAGGELVKGKTCTNIPHMMEAQIVPGYSVLTGEALIKAIDIANEML